MTIRELINCMATDTCQKFQIRADNGWIRLFADLDKQDDPDFILLDAAGDLRIKEWYVNPSSEICIFTDDDLPDELIRLCDEYDFVVV